MHPIDGSDLAVTGDGEATGLGRTGPVKGPLLHHVEGPANPVGHASVTDAYPDDLVRQGLGVIEVGRLCREAWEDQDCQESSRSHGLPPAQRQGPGEQPSEEHSSGDGDLARRGHEGTSPEQVHG